MNYNHFNYYRANPYAHNDFIPQASMTNRRVKQFPSEIPQGEEHLTSRPGRRIFRQKVQMSEIQRDSILKSPQRYPFENRIALNKQFKRNLETVDIEGAAAGTKVSESLRNKSKANELLRQKQKGNKQQILTKSRLIGQSLDAVYEKKRRQLAVQMSKNIDSRKSTEKLNQNNEKILDIRAAQQNQRFSQQKYSPKITNPQMVQDNYKRYVAHNSNQKYTGNINSQNVSQQYDGFQRYKRPQYPFMTLQKQQNQRGNSIENNILTGRNQQQQNNVTNNRGNSIDYVRNNNSNNTIFGQNMKANNHEIQSLLNSRINVNNRYRSNPEYIESYSIQHQKRVEENQKTKKIESTIQQTFNNNRKQFRRNNPTNLSFNIAAKSSLMSTII